MLCKCPCLCGLGVLQVAAGEGDLLAFGYREGLGYISRLYLFFLFVLHRAHREAEVAAVVVPARFWIEADAPRVVLVARAERRRPVAAVGAGIVEARAVAIARSGEENRVAVDIACYLVTVHTILPCPSPCALFTQLRPFGIGRHTPITTPVGSSGIILRLQGGQGVCIVAVLGDVIRTIITIIMLVGCPRVIGFGCGLAPSVVVAVAFGCGGTYVA